MTRSDVPSRRGHRLAIASAAAVAAISGLLAVLAPAAGAASAPIADSELHWGFKSSFRSYVVNIAGGSVTPSDGASFEGSGGQARPYVWDGAGGTYDPATNAGTIDFAGKVVYSAPLHTIWHITIADPTVVLDGDATGMLIADVSYSQGGTQQAPEKQGAATDVHLADVTVTTPTGTAPTFTFTDLPAALTAAGSEAFNGFYAAGTALDPLSSTVSLADVTPPAAPTVTITKPINASNQSAVTVSGTGEAGTTAAISVDDGDAGTAPVTASVPVGTNGSYTATLDLTSLADGTVTATVTLTDAAGNVSPAATATSSKSTAPSSNPLAGLLAQLQALLKGLLGG